MSSTTIWCGTKHDHIGDRTTNVAMFFFPMNRCSVGSLLYSHGRRRVDRRLWEYMTVMFYILTDVWWFRVELRYVGQSYYRDGTLNALSLIHRHNFNNRKTSHYIVYSIWFAYKIILNYIACVMTCVFAAGVVDHGFEPLYVNCMLHMKTTN